jgi:hypothetical protein
MKNSSPKGLRMAKKKHGKVERYGNDHYLVGGFNPSEKY